MWTELMFVWSVFLMFSLKSRLFLDFRINYTRLNKFEVQNSKTFLGRGSASLLPKALTPLFLWLCPRFGILQTRLCHSRAQPRGSGEGYRDPLKLCIDPPIVGMIFIDPSNCGQSSYLSELFLQCFHWKVVYFRISLSTIPDWTNLRFEIQKKISG